MSPQLVQVATRIDKAKADRLAEIAAAEDRSVSSLLRRALEREIALHEDGATGVLRSAA
jgi:predicted transcriptional regulator